MIRMNDKPSRKSFRSRLDVMVHRLRTDMLDGIYKPGDYLPSESTLVEQFQLSNKSVRKGLERLVDEGLIVKIHRVGSKVTEAAQRTGITITLAFSHTIENDLGLTKQLNDFHRKHPGIRVKTMLITSEYPLTVKNYLVNGIIDVFTLNPLDFQEFMENGMIDSLEPLPVNRQTYPFLTKAFMHEENLCAQPLIFSPIVLCYNKAHFREAGLPEPDGSWTWDNVVRHASVLSEDKKKHGFYFHLLSENRWPNFLLQSGEKFTWDADGRCDIRSTRLLDGIRLCKRLVRDPSIFPPYMSEGSSDVSQWFLQGKLSMIVTSYTSMNPFIHSGLSYDISPLPFSHEPKSLTVIIGMAINKHAKEKEAAKLLVDHLCSESAQQAVLRETLSIPGFKTVAESAIADDRLNRPARFHLFRETLGTLRTHKDLNLTAQGFRLVRDLLKMYWSDMFDEETLCREIRERLTPEYRYGGSR